MFITFNKPQADAEEQIKELEAQRAKEEEQFILLTNDCIAEAEKQFKVNAYCPVCGCAVDPEDERAEIDNPEPYHKQKIRFIPQFFAYTEISGLELHCPHCGSNFIENEHREKRLTSTGVTIIKATIAVLAGLLIISIISILCIKNADRIHNILENTETTQSEDTEQSESASNQNFIPDETMHMIRIMIGLLGCIIIVTSIAQVAKGLVNCDQINYPLCISSLIIGILLMSSALFFLVPNVESDNASQDDIWHTESTDTGSQFDLNKMINDIFQLPG